jgi:NAD(P)H-flavin reductase
MGKSVLKDIYLPEPASLVRMQPMTVAEKLFEFRLDSGHALGHLPGQFVQLSIPGIGEAPISVSSPPDEKGTFEMVIRKVGNVTNAAHNLNPGDRVGIRGPFGTAFPVTSVMKGKDILFVCGGIGIFPLRSVIKYVLDRRADYGKVFILSGTRTPGDRLFTDEFAQWSACADVQLLETVDRGDADWKGNVGVVTTLFPKISLRPERTVAVIVGPPVMYKFVLLELSLKCGMSSENIYMSLERNMKCGVGKCGHCQINGLYACQDGPVFRYSEIANVREAI